MRDEIFLLESSKGQRKLPRAAGRRGGVAAKPGLSAEQIRILIARDRASHHIDAVLPDRSEAAVRPVLKRCSAIAIGTKRSSTTLDNWRRQGSCLYLSMAQQAR